MKAVRLTARERIVLALYRASLAEHQQMVDGVLGLALRRPVRDIEGELQALDGLPGSMLVEFSEAARHR